MKIWYKSKIIWFNVISGIILITNELIINNTHEQLDIANIVVAINTIGNILLRLITSTSLVSNEEVSNNE